MDDDQGAAAALLEQGVGRRTLLRAAAGMASLGAVSVSGVAGAGPAASAAPPLGLLQPGTGPVRGQYVPTTVATALWGRLPNRDTAPVAQVRSGSVVTVDALSHEGLLEDQGKDPRAYFGGFGVPSTQRAARRRGDRRRRRPRRTGPARRDRPGRGDGRPAR